MLTRRENEVSVLLVQGKRLVVTFKGTFALGALEMLSLVGNELDNTAESLATRLTLRWTGHTQALVRDDVPGLCQ